MEKSVMRNVKR